MKPEMQKKLIEAIKAELAKPAKGAKNAPFEVRKTSQLADEKRPSPVYTAIRRRLLKQRLWKPINEQLCRMGFGILLAKVEKTMAKPSDPRQMLLDGFENLPPRIRTGRTSTPFRNLTVPQFLAYKVRFDQRNSKRTEKDQLIASELQRLAEQLKPFIDSDKQLGELIAPPTKLVVLK